MTTAQILATLGTTKTWKMQQLFALGHTRREVATLLGVGYGFAQNVYAAWVQYHRAPCATAATAPLTTLSRPAPSPAASASKSKPTA